MCVVHGDPQGRILCSIVLDIVSHVRSVDVDLHVEENSHSVDVVFHRGHVERRESSPLVQRKGREASVYTHPDLSTIPESTMCVLKRWTPVKR